MKVGGIAGNEDAPRAKSGDLAVMDTEIAASVEGASFKTDRRGLPEYVRHKLERRDISICLPNRSDNSATAGAHGEDRDRAEFAGA